MPPRPRRSTSYVRDRPVEGSAQYLTCRTSYGGSAGSAPTRLGFATRYTCRRVARIGRRAVPRAISRCGPPPASAEGSIGPSQVSQSSVASTESGSNSPAKLNGRFDDNVGLPHPLKRFCSNACRLRARRSRPVGPTKPVGEALRVVGSSAGHVRAKRSGPKNQRSCA